LLLVCSAGIVVSYMVLSFAFMSGSIVLLMAGRILGGATAAGQPISLAALVDVSAPANKDFWLSMGMLGSALGFVVGPTVGAFFSDNRIAPEFNTRTPLLITGLLGCFNFALLWAFFREPRQSQAGRVLRVGPSWASAIFSLGEAFRRSGLRRISLVFLLQEMAWGAYFFFVPTFLIDQFEASGTASSLFIAVMGIGFCMSFAVVMPVLTKQFTCRAITSGGLLAFLILVAISALSPNIFLEWVVVLPISVASAVSYGALIILFTDHSLEDTKGEIMGITAALSAVAFGAISFIGGGLAALDERVPLICACILTTLACVAHHVQLHKTVQQ
ncbi:MAG TPA: MFS transporter, partial [Terrimicrobiaceae bacterium]